MASRPHSLSASDPVPPNVEGHLDSAQRDAEASTFADRAWRYAGLPDAIVRAEEAFRSDLDSLLLRTRSLIVIDWRFNREIHAVIRNYLKGTAEAGKR